MATGTDKFLNYNGLVKLIGLIKKRINDAVGSIDLSWKTNKFVKSIAGYGTGAAPTSTSGVNDTKNKLEGTYTTGNLDGTGTDISTNKFTYIDTTYGAASTNKAGLMSSADKTKLDNLSATGASKGANLVKYDKTAATTAGSVAEAIKNLQGAVGGGDLVKQINTATQESQISGSINYNPNTVRTGNYTKANGDPATFTYYETTYDAATPDTGSGQAIVAGKTGLMSSADKTKLDSVATGAQVNVIEHVRLAGESTDLAVTNKRVTIPTATATANGLMNKADKTKLDDLSGRAWEDKGASLIGYDKDMFNEMPATVADALDLLNPYIIHVTKNGNRYEYVDFDWQEYQAAFDTGRQIYVYDDTNKRICTPNSQSSSDVKYINYNPNTGVVSDYRIGETGVTVVETNLASVSYITSNYVPTSRTINGTALTSDIVLKSGNINLTSNITVDGTSKGNVQDALTALNTLAAANKSAISTLQSGGLTREVVTALPTGSNIKTNVIYMILASNDPLDSGDPSTSATTTPYGTNNNSYNEYMYINNAWERIGSTEVNLDIDPITDDEIDTAWSTTVAAA